MDNKNYIPVCSLIGGGCSAAYAFRHPSEKMCIKFSQMKPSIPEAMKGYMDSFNIEQAKSNLYGGQITEGEYNSVRDLYNAIKDTYNKEQKVVDVLNTPYGERTVTLKSAIKDANASRPKLWKHLIKFSRNMQDKYAELGIFDKEQFEQVYNAAAKKAKLMFKETSKRMGMGLVIGSAIGAAVGYYLNRISNK